MVGALAAIVDLMVYYLALGLGLWVHLARALSFVASTVLAYVLNRRWSFDVSGSRRRAVRFAGLYVATFFLVLLLNAMALAILPSVWWTITAGWAISQLVGSTFNFLMLRSVIFRQPGARDHKTFHVDGRSGS